MTEQVALITGTTGQDCAYFAEYLLSLGHRRIGIIVGIPGLATSDDRHAGYLKAFADSAW